VENDANNMAAMVEEHEVVDRQLEFEELKEIVN